MERKKMSDIFQKDSYIDTFGNVYQVDLEHQQSGGQGTFMRTMTNDLALKVMHSDNMQTLPVNEHSSEKYMSIRILPIPDHLHVTLPLAPLSDADGYVMRLLDGMIDFHSAFTLRVSDFAEMATETEALDKPELFRRAHKSKRGKLLYSYMTTGGLRRRLLAYMKAGAILAQLHTHGLVYCDFSDRNAFISKNLDFDQVWMIDADNMEFSEKIKGGFFTPGIAAPELIRGESKCTFYSDCFAYAVSFFQQLFHHHPFEGRAYQDLLDRADFADDVDQIRDEGRLPWILDDEETSNNGKSFLLLPDKYVLTNGIRMLFQQTFTVLYDDSKKIFSQMRPSMMQWAYEAAWAYDNTVYSEGYGLDYIDEDVNFGICPYDDKKINTVRLRSYLLGDDEEKIAMVWQFTHEILPKDISVTLRLIEGFICGHEDDTSFSLEQIGGDLIIHSRLLNSVVAYSEDSDLSTAQFQTAGSFRTSRDKFLIRCQQDDGTIVLIEGEIHGC